MKQLGLAVHNSATADGGKMPRLYEVISTDPYVAHNWPVALLGYVERSDLVNRIDPVTAQLSLQVFTCPSDANNYRQPGGLSFAANAGYGNFPAAAIGAVFEGAAANSHNGYGIDWDADSVVAGDRDDADVARSTGVFWPDAGDGFRQNLDRISGGDGLTNTLMLAENANSQNWAISVADFSTGAASSALDTAFAVHVPAPGSGEVITPTTQVTGTNVLSVVGIAPTHSFINSSAGVHRGRSPAPSSFHPGTVNVVFCDGHGTSLNQGMDFRIYVRLMTPNGVRRGQTPIGDDF
jgi:prepilin-type processing-associated H-X9-DG protein